MHSAGSKNLMVGEVWVEWRNKEEDLTCLEKNNGDKALRKELKKYKERKRQLNNLRWKNKNKWSKYKRDWNNNKFKKRRGKYQRM